MSDDKVLQSSSNAKVLTKDTRTERQKVLNTPGSA